MKHHLLELMICTIWFSYNFSAVADPRIVTDPVSDYISRHSTDLRLPEERNEHILKFEVDVNSDGKMDIFLSSEKSALVRGDQYENDVRLWDLYLKIGEGSYAVIDQEKSAAGSDTYLHYSNFLFDPQRVYVGSINEVGGASGMLAMNFVPRKNGVYISAYIPGNSSFESKNFPDPMASEAGMYHRDDSGNIPDLPDAYKHYFATPPSQTMTVLPQTF